MVASEGVVNLVAASPADESCDTYSLIGLVLLMATTKDREVSTPTWSPVVYLAETTMLLAEDGRRDVVGLMQALDLSPPSSTSQHRS
jgi:hypothetical protein